MPDKSTQDWTDDAAFWNEAWADMEQRLDRNDRKGAAWWRWLLPLLLLVAGGVAWFGWSQYLAPATAETTTEAKTPDAPKPIVQAGQTKLPDAVPLEAETTSPQRQAAIPVATNPAAPLPRSLKPSTAPAAPPTSLKAGVSNVQGSETAFTPVQTTEAPAYAPQRTATATPPIPFADLTSVSYASDLPSVTLQTAKVPDAAAVTSSLVKPRKIAYGLSAGSTLSPGMDRPGFLFGGYATFRPRQRVSFSTGLRFRQDELKIGTDDNREGDFSTVGTPTTGDFSAVRPFVSSQSIGNRRLDRLTLSGLELTGGASLRAGKRLHISGALGLEYLLIAKGLAGLSLSDNGLQVSYVTSTPLFSFAEDELAEAFVSNNLASNEVSRGLGGSTGSTINRWLLRAETSLEYRIGNRFALTASYARLLTPVYDSDLLRARPGQFGAGIKFRLR